VQITLGLTSHLQILADSFTDAVQAPQPASQTPIKTTPGTSHGESPQSHEPGLLAQAPPRTRFEFEVAEVEEADYDIAGNH
jgi:hypothetical protein